MAQNFKRYCSRGVGTSLKTIGDYIVGPGATSTAIGLNIANVAGVPLTVDVMHNDGTNATALVKGASVPPGMSLVVIGGDQKLVLQAGDSLQIKASVAAGVDAVMSVLEKS